jgi:uncharacterized protein
MTDTESVVRAFYSALGQGDANAALALLDKDVRWSEAERVSYYTGEVRGVDAVVKTVFEPINRDFDNFAVNMKEVIAQNDRATALGIYTGRGRVSGRDLNAPFVHAWTVRDGKLTTFQQYTDSAAWTEAFHG